MRWIVIVAAHLFVALQSFSSDSSTGTADARAVSAWPAVYAGRSLHPITATALDARFAAGFPGAAARFTDGESEFLFREVYSPTRQLHAAADCYRGAGFEVTPHPALRADDGALLGCVLARRNDKTFRVCERIDDAQGHTWYDVSSWFWAAVTRRTQAPWRAVTIATPWVDTNG